MWGAAPGGDHGQPVSVEIIIPAYNEAQRLPAGLEALTTAAAALPCGAAVLVVDNASTDGTAAIVKQWPDGPVPVRLLHCPRRGKGAAVRTGLLASRAAFVGYLDADMATELSALGTAISLLVSGRQVVVGSRAHRESVVEDRHSRARTLGAAFFRGAARVIVAGVSDTQCGFKFFSGPLARAAATPMSTSGFSFDVELLARCLRLGADVTEIPVQWRDMPGSTFSVPRHSVSAFTQLASIWLSLRSERGSGPRPIPIPPLLDLEVPARISERPPVLPAGTSGPGRTGGSGGSGGSGGTAPAWVSPPGTERGPGLLAGRI